MALSLGPRLMGHLSGVILNPGEVHISKVSCVTPHFFIGQNQSWGCVWHCDVGGAVLTEHDVQATMLGHTKGMNNDGLKCVPQGSTCPCSHRSMEITQTWVQILYCCSLAR